MSMDLNFEAESLQYEDAFGEAEEETGLGGYSWQPVPEERRPLHRADIYCFTLSQLFAYPEQYERSRKAW